MGVTDSKTGQGEDKLTALLLQRKVITEGQLKAALDYQRSLGGQIVDILIKLDLVRASQIEECAQKLDSPEPAKEARGDLNVLDPETVKVSELKVHRRLLEKIPKPLVEEHLLIPFFPAAKVDSRKIILGHGHELRRSIEEKVRTIVGVDLCTLELPEKVAREILEEHHRGGDPHPRKPAGAKPAFRSARPPGVGDDVVLNALLNVLSKRGVITAEELQVEAEHLQGG
jgi:hypothetical protein